MPRPYSYEKRVDMISRCPIVMLRNKTKEAACTTIKKSVSAMTS
jgi:hypothetical protein